MSLYKRGQFWWYAFRLQGAFIRETTGLTNKSAAAAIEMERKLALRNARVGVSAKRTRVPLFSVAAESWLRAKQPEWAPKTLIGESGSLKHLDPVFGKRLLSDISADDVAAYRTVRISQGAAPKTISLELGTLRAVLRFHDMDATWAAIGKKIKLAKAEKLGRVINAQEERTLLDECRNSRSRSLYVAVVMALQACMRYSEIRQLRWQQVDLIRRVITVGKSKTDAGEGRQIPMSQFLHLTLSGWAAQFQSRKLNHYVFAKEKYGQNGTVYAMDATKPIGTFKYAWKDARKRAGVDCRFHDLRHTGCTRMLDAGVPHPVVAEIMGWSTSTAIRMIKEVYGHISLVTRVRAIEQVEAFMEAQNSAERTQKRTQPGDEPRGMIQ